MNARAPTSRATILLRDYIEGASATDRFANNDLHPILLGLFGEVGGIMAAVKKNKREGDAFLGYRPAVVEEFGDVLWYLTALCRRVGKGVDKIFAAATQNERYATIIATNEVHWRAVAEVAAVKAPLPELDQTLLNLGMAAARLLSIETASLDIQQKLVGFADTYLHALEAAGVSFAEVVQGNLSKADGSSLPIPRRCRPSMTCFRKMSESLQNSPLSSANARVGKVALSGTASSSVIRSPITFETQTAIASTMCSTSRMPRFFIGRQRSVRSSNTSERAIP
jgi:NTP pyrophosphatase (non-canonical NTP hydrolase)